MFTTYSKLISTIHIEMAAATIEASYPSLVLPNEEELDFQLQDNIEETADEVRRKITDFYYLHYFDYTNSMF